jgi:uncharacterized protein (DUF58 family)
LVALIGLTAFLGLLAAFVPEIAPVWVPLAGLLILVAAFDALLTRFITVPEVARTAPGSVSLATWVDIQLTIRNRAKRGSLRFQVFDHYPRSVIARDLPQEHVVKASRYLDMSYSVRPAERGRMEFTTCELRIASHLGLWWRRHRVPLETTIRCYPNYSTISKLLAYEVDNRLQLAGVRLSRRRGEGIEFNQLRDYRDGDSLRAIDWKATARMSRLITREYQDERDQQVIFMLDAGRRMLAKDEELSHFDHTLNAMLLLGYVALRQGDSAGVMTVGDQRTWLPPRKGMDAITTILNHVYDVQPQPVEIDYVAAATDLALRQRRRSLIVLLTNVREEDSQDLRIATELLRRRHLVIIGSLRERVLDETLAHKIQGFDDALLFAATHQYLDARRESQDLLRASGAFVEDCLSDELPARITNRYLAIKRAGIL